MNGRPLDIVLGGTNGALRGKAIIAFGGSSVETQVNGSYNPETRVLLLEDAVDAPDAGRYSATLSEDGARMVGSFQFRDRSDHVAFTASRSR